MARTKTQKQLSISKTKSVNIVEWFVNDAHWKLLSENLELGKTAIFKYKKIIKETNDEQSAFDALAEVFTLKQLNTVITMFNDFIENPEKYEKPKKKSEVDLEKQEETVKKHMKDMNMDYLNYEKQSDEGKKQETKAEAKENEKKAEEKASESQKEAPKEETKEELLARQSEEANQARKEINELPENSPERVEKEQQFQKDKAKRMKEFWDLEKRQ
ncbi:hypothetical protein [Mammaliicoccus lentus]|uniref:hypothetical protein n=1 Tax=Mammaliicoccus lentus TaxID=42858 RepID=UPI0010721FF1|nr:hypothetical protein [Mammaliicoccus lentus]MBF0795177.1 hypothetical protein [Mammaliicoccus lentus]MBF0795269.1 hypothetical protein [Mammaliicoccus lentus]TFV14579.1 hypothetical protein E4T78_10975 [Mammaliicoccus lentus]TFV14665.1 hypothetical protein E4T78_11415 [Mammaliicoccus lentus]